MKLMPFWNALSGYMVPAMRQRMPVLLAVLILALAATNAKGKVGPCPRKGSVGQKPDRIHLQSATGIIHFHKKLLPLDQRMKSAVIQHPRMHEHILVKAIRGDKAVAAKIVEELHHGAYFALFGFGGRWRCRGQRPFDGQKVLDHAAMLIGAEGDGDDITGEEAHKTEPVQSRSMEKDLFLADPDKPVPLAFIIPDQITLADLYFACCVLRHLHYPVAPAGRRRIGDTLLPVCAATPLWPSHNRKMMRLFKPRTKGQKRKVTAT